MSSAQHVLPPPRTMSSDSFEDGRRSPSHEEDSESALILANEEGQHDDLDTMPFELSSDEDELEENDLFSQPQSGVEPLSSLTVFLYLLSPLLKLGALLSPYEIAQLPLKVALPGLFFFASLCAFSRQIWYMLSRYVRRADIEEVFLETIARGRAREGRRYMIRMAVRFSTALLRVLLVVVYLRSCADATLRYIPEKFVVPPRIVATTGLALLVSPLCFAPSVASSPVIYSTWMSVATYVAWLATVAYAHAKGMFFSPKETYPPALWEGLSIIAFAYSTSYTIPLYAALRGNPQPGMPKSRRSRSFKLFSLLSIVVATGLILPPVLFNSEARELALQNAAQPTKTVVTCWSLLSVATLMLGIPFTFVSIPTLPVPLSIRRNTNLPVSRIVLFVTAFFLSFLSGSAFRAICDVLLVLAFLGTFTIPALIHIIIHNFRRPLSIVMPGTPAPGQHGMHRSDSYNDELLQRKERTLQRRRLARRIMWDVVVWTLLLPVSGGALLWAGGRLVGRW